MRRPSTRLQDYPQCVLEYWRNEYENGVKITQIAREIGLPAHTVIILINKQLSKKLRHERQNTHRQ
ncbi:MAG: hypothetical protein J0L94_01090 [Rhodothermia bacterium]|nr:hypothetical protein [Rhodothermia bacterium]